MCLIYQYYYIHSNFERMYLFIVFFFGDNLGRTRTVVVSFVDNLHHSSSSIIIHHHPSSYIIIHHHHPSSDCAGEKPRQGEHDGRPPVIRTYICMLTFLSYHPLPTRYILVFTHHSLLQRLATLLFLIATRSTGLEVIGGEFSMPWRSERVLNWSVILVPSLI